MGNYGKYMYCEHILSKTHFWFNTYLGKTLNITGLLTVLESALEREDRKK